MVSPSPHIVDLRGPEDSIKVSEGDTLSVQLPSVQGTPYLWSVETAPGLASSGAKVVLADELPGAGSTTEFRIRIDKLEGRKSLQFKLKAPWEDEIQEVRRLNLEPE
jgi:predicted secreted protein